MDLFPDGQQVRLRNRVRGTFLRADDDGVGVSLGASPDDAAWEVRLVLRDGFTYVLLGVRGRDRFLALSPGRRGERRVVQAERRYDGEVLWRATWVGTSKRQRRYILLRHAFLGLCLRADGRVAGVSVDHVRNECTMMHWVVEADSDASAAPPPPPPSSLAVWAPLRLPSSPSSATAPRQPRSEPMAAMELFPDGQRVRLRNRAQGTFLRADDDGAGVSLRPRGDDAAWEVRLVLRDGFTYVLLGVRGRDRFLAVSPGRRGERRVVQAERRYDGEVLWRATWVGRSMRQRQPQRRYVLLRHAFLGLCLRADGRVAGVSVDHVRNECDMINWEVEADSDASARPPPPSSSLAVWAPVVRAGEADGGLSSSWLPLMDSRGGLVAHLPGNLVGGTGQVLRDRRGHLQVHAHAAASLVRAAWDRVGRDLRAGALLAVVPEDVARLAAARPFLAAGGAFRAAQRALWPRAAVLLPLRLVGDGNAPDAAARARRPPEEAGPDADGAAVHPGPRAVRARPQQQQQIAGRGRKSIRKARNALFAYKPEVEEPAGGYDDGDLPPSPLKLLLSRLSTLEHGMLRRQGQVRDRLQELGELEVRAQRRSSCTEDEVSVKGEIRKHEEAILSIVDSYDLISPMADELRQDIADRGATPPRPHPALAQSPEGQLTPSLRLRLQRRREKKEKKDGHH